MPLEGPAEGCGEGDRDPELEDINFETIVRLLLRDPDFGGPALMLTLMLFLPRMVDGLLGMELDFIDDGPLPDTLAAKLASPVNGWDLPTDETGGV